MKILITGASGFVGRLLVQRLDHAGHDLLLVGRSKQKLENIFGSAYKLFAFEDIHMINDVDAVIHLATKNNSVSGSIDEYRSTNVELLETVARYSRDISVKNFIYFSSSHTDRVQKTNYSVSKQEADTLLSSDFADLNVTTLVLPAVYSDNAFAGNLSILTKVPRKLQKLGLNLLSTVRPVVHVEVLVKRILGVLDGNETDKRIYVSGRQTDNWIYQFCSRAIDFAFALAVIVLLWWLFAIVWVKIRLTSPGPGLFAQERVGKNGLKFVCFKFRTMEQGTKIAGTHEVSSDSVTAFGKIIRKLKIDELPQVWNILKGDMSLVGPRPCLPVQTQLIEERKKRGVYDVRCGLTGLSQVNDIDMSDPVRLAKADARYLAIRTVPLDLKIIFQTFLGAGRSDRVKAEDPH